MKTMVRIRRLRRLRHAWNQRCVCALLDIMNGREAMERAAYCERKARHFDAELVRLQNRQFREDQLFGWMEGAD